MTRPKLMSFAPRMSEPLVAKRPFESMAGRKRWVSIPLPLPASGSCAHASSDIPHTAAATPHTSAPRIHTFRITEAPSPNYPLGRKPNISSQDDRLPGKALVTSFGESVTQRLRLLFAVASLVTSLAAARGARADAPSLDGTWRQGPLKEEYTVQKWLSACGPAPVS